MRRSIYNLGLLLCMHIDGRTLAFQTQISKRNKGTTASHAAAQPDTGSSKKKRKPPKPLRPGSLAAATAEIGRVPYGESSRQYRRTVYTVDDWKRHRSNDRILDNIRGIFFSGIIRQLRNEVAIVSLVALLVVLWNVAAAPVWHLVLLRLPSLPFTLCSPALGLLLVFRTNASYARWSEARITWGRLGTQSVNMMRMAVTFSGSGHEPALERLILVNWVFLRSIMNRLTGDEDEVAYENDLTNKLASTPHANLIPRLLAARNRPVAAMMEVSLALDSLPIDEKRRVEIDKSLVILGDCLGTCERIFTSPIPLVYTRHTGRFLSLYMLLLPMAMYELLHSWALVPAMAILSVFLFGIDELSIQLEEPFSILPMQRFCDGILDDCYELKDWSNASAK